MFVNGPDNAMLVIILVSIGLIALILILRYVLRKIFNKASDAIENKFTDMKNQKNAGSEQNLSDRHK